MIGMLVLSEDGEVGAAILPSVVDPHTVLLFVHFHDLELPPIPVPADDLQASLEVWFGNQKTNRKA